MTDTTPDSLTEIFAAFAVKAQQDHPKLEGELLVYDEPNKTFIGNFDLAKHAVRQDQFGRLLNSVAGSEILGPKVIRLQLRPASGPVDVGSVIAYKPHDIIDSAFGSSARDFTLYHELGHIVVKNSWGGTADVSVNNRAETAADIYAMMRLAQQQPEKIDELMTRLKITRIIALADRDDREHYTLPGLVALEKLGWDAVSKLTPEQAAQKAGEIAAASALPQSVMDGIAKIYTGYREQLKTDKQTALRGLAEALLQADAPVFRMGLKYIGLYLDGAVSQKGFDFSGKYWDDMHKKIDSRDETTAPSKTQAMPKAA